MNSIEGKGNAPPPKGIDNRRVKCVKCGDYFELVEPHSCLGSYRVFINTKSHLSGTNGFDPVWMPDFLYDFQKKLLDWALVKGRSAIFADCGLGKTPIQLAWAENVVRRTNGMVLILTPLAVGHQTLREGTKFGIECSRDLGAAKILVSNYERLHHHDPSWYSGVVCDESSILKNFDGATKSAITDFLKKVPYRLLCTATAAPNDFIELGTSSEALGELGFMDMLSRFFKKNDGASTRSDEFRHGMWRFRGHAETDFWRWVCSWARAVRKPEDMGCDNAQFVLPPIHINEHVVAARSRNEDFLFDLPAMTLEEQRRERRRTIPERCEQAALLAMAIDGPSVSWCHLNDEGTLLHRLITGSEEVSGSDSDERKEEIFAAFESGQVKKLVTKSVIAGWGLNWQHCAHATYFPSHSFEQWYQSIRRFWRFGQKRPVRVDLISSEGESGVLSNLRRKADAADRMFDQLVKLMHRKLKIENTPTTTDQPIIPPWLKTK